MGNAATGSKEAGADVQAQVFELKAQMLSAGRSRDVLARSGSLSLAVKVYAEGGENTLHAHPGEDHIFIVSNGEATFYDREGKTTVLRRGQGMLIPGEYFYRFQATGDEPLVLLRIGGGHRDAAEGRVWLEGVSQKQADMPGVPISGKYWTL